MTRELTNRWEWTSPTAEATFSLGVWLGARAAPGLVVALVGDLGTGKTCFAQGVARGLGVAEQTPVVSPTFTLINPYTIGRFTLFHADLYRLREYEELEALGFRDLFGDSSISVIEWADRFPEILPSGFLEIGFTWRGHTQRDIVARAVGRRKLEMSIIDELLEMGSRVPFL